MIKDKVLSILKNRKDYISGETVSRELGVSRAAVNKAVKALQSEGYMISAVNNKGYLLSESPDILSEQELAALLPKERMENIFIYDSIPSTNLRLSELAYEGASDMTVAIANEQTKGRGRRGRSFSSPKNKGIYLSCLMLRREAPEDVTEITAWTAVAVAKAIETVCGAFVSVKWVNDLILGGKKICGILTEMSIENESRSIRNIIIGIGINVNEEPSDFDEDIRLTASSISAELGKKINRAKLAAELIRRLDKLNEDFPSNKAEYLNYYREHCLFVGNRILVYETNKRGGSESSEDAVEAEALSINDDFSIKVRLPDTGEVKDLSSGEVSIRGLNGYI
ncbi:MAG: biotin--[acetyl-CoA-carboxylase] ligase [Lachnospiraceae bacterium]|nr:biotin--[acetyl-CoA-carboxylase] ligase [Lachnospiraceae bacterium]